MSLFIILPLSRAQAPKPGAGKARARGQLSALLADAVDNRAELEERIAQGRANRRAAGNKYGELTVLSIHERAEESTKERRADLLSFYRVLRGFDTSKSMSLRDCYSTTYSLASSSRQIAKCPRRQTRTAAIDLCTSYLALTQDESRSCDDMDLISLLDTHSGRHPCARTWRNALNSLDSADSLLQSLILGRTAGLIRSDSMNRCWSW